LRIRFCQYKKSDNRREYNPEVKLFAFWRSSCSFRVRIALNLKKISYEIVPVNKENCVHKSWIFSQINPAQLVPILVIHGNILTESLPICEYIDEAFLIKG
jgi:maleylacetoacetate isomerase